MSTTNNYRTLQRPSEAHLFKDKGSKFIGYAYPVEDENRIAELLVQVKAQHPKANHCCYAWRLGHDSSARYRVNDDGEPKNSAGQPIYGQLLSKELTNTLVMVVRYFGGTKLGVGGLINAYKSCAEGTLARASILTKEIQVALQLTFAYQDINKVMRIVKGQNLQLKSQKMELDCEFVVAVNADEFDSVFQLFQSHSGIEVQKI